MGQNENFLNAEYADTFKKMLICLILITLTERVEFQLSKSVTTTSCNSIGEVQWETKKTIMTLILKRLNVILCKYEYIYFSWDCK